MKTFALILFATAVQAIGLHDNGLSSWAKNRGDDWRTDDAEKFGGARAYASDWMSIRSDNSPNAKAVENANENSAVAAGAVYSPAVGGDGEAGDGEAVLGDDEEADDGEESADDEEKGNNRNNDNRMNIDEWKPALKAYREARRASRGEDGDEDGLKSGAGLKRPLAADYKMGAQDW